VWPHRAHGAPLLYERLLPMLNGKPPRANHAAAASVLAPWAAPPHAGDAAHGALVWCVVAPRPSARAPLARSFGQPCALVGWSEPQVT
jgi:hypothetical protein